MLRNMHAFSSDSALVWGCVNSVRDWAGFKACYCYGCPPSTGASNSSSNIFCVQCGLIFQRVFLFPLSAPTFLESPSLSLGILFALFTRGTCVLQSPQLYSSVIFTHWFLVWGVPGQRCPVFWLSLTLGQTLWM